jgi:ADP-glucose pyrophosphorylase
MKKFYLGFSTLICLSVLFTLDSCTTDTPIVAGDTLGKADAKKEIHYYTRKKGDTVLATESVSAKAGTTESLMAIDPDWKILVGHIIDSTGSTY